MLIGGATTSRTHTAVKIEPSYSAGSTTYVLDASRAVGVVSGLLSEDNKDAAEAATREEYVKIREQFSRAQAAKVRTPIAAARANRFKIDWNNHALPPAELHRHADLRAVGSRRPRAAIIDWSPFFAAWELVGRFPAILEDDVVGEVARPASTPTPRPCWTRSSPERWFEARGVVGLWPANSDGDDVIVWTDETRSAERARFHTLRQQMAKSEGRPNTALADFIAPVGQGADFIGGFAVTAGHGEAAIAARYKAEGDDYNAIIAAALADRLAEAFAEALHHKVRAELWGYARGEPFEIDDLLSEKYVGIRPAPGYPAQPDHTEKATLFELLNATVETGIELTESYAMSPPASVSGLYLAHPAAHYFGVGKIERDQVEDYARRKGWPLKVSERWLGPLLNYEPAR